MNNQTKKAKKRQTTETVEEGDIFDLLEEFSEFQYPLCVKKLLRYAAYDSKSSCLLLDEKTIIEVEEYIMENGRDVIDNLNCCNAQSYRTQQRFRFLPGHKRAILAIPTQIQSMESTTNKRRKPIAEFKKLMTSVELKDLLLQRLKQSIVKIGFQGDLFMEEHLSDVQTMITQNEMTAKYKVQCFQCSITRNVIYKSSWGVSNMLRHIKTHEPHSDNNNAPNMPEYLLRNNANVQNEFTEPAMVETLELSFDSPSNDEKSSLLEQLKEGTISLDELIEEEAFVIPDNKVTLSNHYNKIVELEDGQQITLNMGIRP